MECYLNGPINSRIIGGSNAEGAEKALAVASLPPNPKQTSPRPNQPNVISTGATDGLIVRCAVERSLYFVFVLVLVSGTAKLQRSLKVVALFFGGSAESGAEKPFVVAFRWERRVLALRQVVANPEGLKALGPPLPIEQISLAALPKGIEVRIPGSCDSTRIFIVPKRKHRVHIRQQPVSLLHIELRRIEVVESAEDLNSQLGRIQGLAVGQRQCNAGNGLSMGWVVVGIFIHLEAGRCDAHSRNLALGRVARQRYAIDVVR